MEACAVWFFSVPFSAWVLISEIPVQFVLMSVCYWEVEHSGSGLVSPVWWRIPVLETQRRWKMSSYFSYFLRNPYLLRDSAHSPGGWMRWRKFLIASPGLSESVVAVGFHFLDLMAWRTSWRGIGVGELTGKHRKKFHSLLWMEF